MLTALRLLGYQLEDVRRSRGVIAFAAVPLVLILLIVGIMASVINDQQQQIETIESE